MNPLIQSQKTTPLFLVAFVLACFTLSPTAQAQLDPPPDGGYPRGNTAEGEDALFSLFISGPNLFSRNNTAVGNHALFSNQFGSNNTAIGNRALRNVTTGGQNTAIGYLAGVNITGSGNVNIGAGVSTAAGVLNETRIRNVYTSIIGVGGRIVYVDSKNKIGVLFSARRYKEDIKAIDKASEAIYALRPVTFRYKKEVDVARALSFGLIAEEVAKISSDLITRDEHGEPQTVRYEAVNAMLLNEFLKEHRKNEEQEKRIDALTAQLQEQAAQNQKVSAQLEKSKPAPQMVLHSR